MDRWHLSNPWIESTTGQKSAEFDGMYIITSLRAYLLMSDLIFDTYKSEENVMCYPLGRDF